MGAPIAWTINVVSIDITLLPIAIVAPHKPQRTNACNKIITVFIMPPLNDKNKAQQNY